MRNILKKENRGFTIIEVMIVLAIAALIMLVVFLAVPALQRGQRNNARKTDSARVAASVVEYTSNNGGSLPSDTTSCGNLLSSVGKLAQYGFPTTCVAAQIVANVASVPAPVVADTFYIVTNASGGGTVPAPALASAMILANQSICDTANPPVSGKVLAGSTKQTALLYSLESGTNFSWGCVRPQ